MNQTILAIVISASALIMGVVSILQPAAATQIQSNQEIKQGLAQCNINGTTCNNNYQQAANTIVFSHTS